MPTVQGYNKTTALTHYNATMLLAVLRPLRYGPLRPLRTTVHIAVDLYLMGLRCYLPTTTTDIDGGSSLACRIETGAGKVQHDISYHSEPAFPQIVCHPISGGEVFGLRVL